MEPSPLSRSCRQPQGLALAVHPDKCKDASLDVQHVTACDIVRSDTLRPRESRPHGRMRKPKKPSKPWARPLNNCPQLLGAALWPRDDGRRLEWPRMTGILRPEILGAHTSILQKFVDFVKIRRWHPFDGNDDLVMEVRCRIYRLFASPRSWLDSWTSIAFNTGHNE